MAGTKAETIIQSRPTGAESGGRLFVLSGRMRRRQKLGPPPSRQAVQRARHPEDVLLRHVGIDHGGAHVVVSEQFLDRADIGSIIK